MIQYVKSKCATTQQSLTKLQRTFVSVPIKNFGFQDRYRFNFFNLLKILVRFYSKLIIASIPYLNLMQAYNFIKKIILQEVSFYKKIFIESRCNRGCLVSSFFSVSEFFLTSFFCVFKIIISKMCSLCSRLLFY